MSADGMTWTFLLRKGITFHDGTELNAEDVKWSLEMVTKPESIAAFAARLRATIKEIEVADPHTLIIRTHQPDLWLAQDLSMAAGYEGAILPKKYFEQVGADGFAAKAIGSGPYKWVKGLAGSLHPTRGGRQALGRRRAQIQTAYLFGGARGKYAHRYDPDWGGGDHQRQPGAGARSAGPRLQCLREGAR